MIVLKQVTLLAIATTLPMMVHAEAATWQIVPDKSNITFTAVQNGAPVSGQFKKFDGNIHFDPNDLNGSHVSVSIDMTSVNTSYGAIADTLKTAPWFNAQSFPKAEFTSDKFSKTGDKTYQADGKLTIRDKTIPATIKFTLDEFAKDKAKVEGTTSINRTQFGVGQGEWSDTNEVKDKVDVKFDFVLNPAAK